MDDLSKALLDMSKTLISQILDGIKGVQGNVSEMASQVDRVAELAKAEPTRQSLKEFIRETLSQHQDCVRDQIGDHDKTCMARHERTQSLDEENAERARCDAIKDLNERLKEWGDVKQLVKDVAAVKTWFKIASPIFICGLAYFIYLYHSTNGAVEIIKKALELQSK